MIDVVCELFVEVLRFLFVCDGCVLIECYGGVCEWSGVFV